MTPRLERHQLFISYSRADREWVDRLKTMLGPLLRGEDLQLWDDSQIVPGARWKEEIVSALAKANVALLLVSSDFLNSDFIHKEELPPLLRAAEEKGLVLLWVKLRPCLVHRTAIHAYQAVLDPARPLSAMAPWEQEAALEMVAQRIDAVLQDARDRLVGPREEQERQPLERREKEREEAPPQPAPPELTRQRLAETKTARILSSSGLLGRRTWRVETDPLAVWGVVEELAPGVPLQMVEIPRGSFSMGSPPGEEGRDVYGQWREDWKRLAAVEGVDVEAQRLVTVPGCWLGRCPITQAQWQVVAGWPRLERELNPDPATFKGVDRPVEQVSWHDAVEFCRRLSQRTGRTYSLPSEALWEYACRAGTTTPFHFGATLGAELANFRGTVSYGSGPTGEFREHTTPVGSFPANAWGLHDMHGNVWEWCLDRWHPSPRQGPSDGRPWLEPAEGLPAEGQELRLLRGGSWFDVPHYCRSACRDRTLPADHNDNVGFRVCCLPPGSPPWPSNP
ncbi:MAG: SUMF1/EgtB/PvdO family nonheme iron enzyme [Cyanobacteriota bacterium]|nr:SUMF1/EgtB/PvdO family nonheme iron enzyme [Cyanobacteriota bacterium]